MNARVAGLYFAFMGLVGVSVAGILAGADLYVALKRALMSAGVFGVIGCFFGFVFSRIMRETFVQEPMEEKPDNRRDKEHEPASS
jgi:hypothetical protein